MNNIFHIKRSWSKLVSTRRSTVLIVSLQLVFPGYTMPQRIVGDKLSSLLTPFVRYRGDLVLWFRSLSCFVDVCRFFAKRKTRQLFLTLISEEKWLLRVDVGGVDEVEVVSEVSWAVGNIFSSLRSVQTCDKRSPILAFPFYLKFGFCRKETLNEPISF